jgi:hypothetical protein
VWLWLFFVGLFVSIIFDFVGSLSKQQRKKRASKNKKKKNRMTKITKYKNTTGHPMRESIYFIHV